MRYIPAPGFWDGPPQRKNYPNHEAYMEAETIYREVVDNATVSDRAGWYAKVAHRTQKRKNGIPYDTHTTRVAMAIASDPRLAEKHVAAGHLHDVTEDFEYTGVTLEMIGELFGMEIAELVDWMTNKSKGMNLGREERKKLDRERLAAAPSDIKRGYSDSFRRKYAQETVALVGVLRDADPELADRVLAVANEVLESASRMPVLGKPGMFVKFRHLNEERAQRTHSQTLLRLSERGGLSPEEMLCVVDDLNLFAHRMSDDVALAELQKRGILEKG